MTDDNNPDLGDIDEDADCDGYVRMSIVTMKMLMFSQKQKTLGMMVLTAIVKNNDYDQDGDGYVDDMYAEEAGLPGGDCDDENIDISRSRRYLV